MEAFLSLASGLSVAIEPMNMLFALIGVLLGTAVGVLPGIGPALTVALLLPITFKLDPAGSIIMFAGIYYGGMYGGSTTAILINTPGESASMATALEGNLMAKAGRGGPALATAAIGSFVAGTIATLGLTFLAPYLVDIAVSFGPEDYFALMVVAFVTVSATFGDSPVRGLTSLFIGLLLGLVGIDILSGQSRLSFGVPELYDNIEVTTLAVGLFAVGEALYVASRRHVHEEKLESVRGSLWMTKEDWKRSWKPWLRGTAFGFPIGALPAGGAEIPTFLSYATEKRLTKHPEDFGHGAIEGVAGPEAANNASAAGTLVPLLTLGLPTSATAAMMLAGFQQYGLNPGPLLFAEKPDLVWGLIASLFIANIMLLVLNLPLVGLWVKLLAIPQPWLYAGILVFATMGTIAANPSPVELVMLAVFGVLGFLMRRFDFPIAPVVVGLILGPVAESQLRRALSISLGDPVVLVQSPISATLLVIALIALVAPVSYSADMTVSASGNSRHIAVGLYRTVPFSQQTLTLGAILDSQQFRPDGDRPQKPGCAQPERSIHVLGQCPLEAEKEGGFTAFLLALIGEQVIQEPEGSGRVSGRARDESRATEDDGVVPGNDDPYLRSTSLGTDSIGPDQVVTDGQTPGGEISQEIAATALHDQVGSSESLEEAPEDGCSSGIIGGKEVANPRLCNIVRPDLPIVLFGL
jgi:putative tricarboxylic transport membrane protein